MRVFEGEEVYWTSSSRLAQPLGDGYPRQWALVRLEGTEYLGRDQTHPDS